MIKPRQKRTTDEEFGYFNSEELKDPLLKQDVAKAFGKLAAVIGILVGLVTRRWVWVTGSSKRPPTPPS